MDKFQGQRGIAHLLLLLILGLALSSYLLITHTPIGKLIRKIQLVQAATPIRGASGDTWADIIIGKSDFSEITPFTVVASKLFLPHGVIVDRSTSPNKMYIYDAGNNRVLGLDLDKCLSASTCSADIVIGQPSLSTSACNGDSAFQNYPDRAPASEKTLCGEQESLLSISEGGSGSSMALDSQGNLYVTDFWNHRVLKYNQPFTTDTIADDVWGQNDFVGNSCNKGQSSPDNSSICFDWGRSNNWTAGVDVDGSGNLWVVDSGNNRVLRFPTGSKSADLVLGQSDFSSRAYGSGLNQFNAPAVVRVNSQGRVYVADQGNNRILTFDLSFSNGMSGQVFSSGFSAPAGIDFDPQRPGKVWIADTHSDVIKLVDESTGSVIEQLGQAGNPNIVGDATGSIGIDSSGNIYMANGQGDNSNDVIMFTPSVSTQTPAKKLFGATYGNQLTAAGLASGEGIVVTQNQLIVAERGRILFWNDPSSISSGKSADGVTGPGGLSDFSTYKRGCCYTAKADKNGHLYVSEFHEADAPDRIEIYNLPLTTGALPVKTLTYPFDVLGGGQIASTGLPFGGLAPSDMGDFLWVSHPATNRTFRLRDPLGTPKVDIILGQPDLTSTSCNRGSAAVSGALDNTLCSPGAVQFDRQGNLFLSDHWLEAAGNMRLLVFNKDLLPIDNTSVIFAPSASKTFSNVATWEPAFNSKNQMLIGYDPYWSANPQGGWFPGFYSDPLGSLTAPNSFLNDYYSAAVSAAFDDSDNLYVGDINRGRILFYKQPFGPPLVTPSFTPTPTPIPTSTPTPTPTPTPDRVSPSVTITNPINGGTVKVKSTISIAANASDNVSVAKVEFYVGATLKCTDTTPPYSCSWVVPDKVNVTYILQAKAYDSTGNTASSSVKVTSKSK